MSVLEIVLAMSAGVCVFALVMTLMNLAMYRRAPAAGMPASGARRLPAVSVCIPARNEEANIEACVQGLLRGTLRDIEVMVYDDESTDQTGAILSRLKATEARLHTVPTHPLPEGWNGKQHACWRAAGAAKGDWLLFTDADVRFEPACLERTLAEAERGDRAFISTFPRQRTGSLAEIMVVPMIHFILFTYLPFGMMKVSRNPAASAGCGQFLFIHRDAYAAIGGHEAFKSTMHDGIMMPRAVRRAGLSTDLFDGSDLCAVRMYTGFGQTWRGFAKNAYEGLGSITMLLFMTVMHLGAHLLPWGVLAAGALGAEVSRLSWWLAGGAVAVQVVQRTALALRFGQNPLVIVLHPLSLVLLTAIQWRSWWLHVRKRRSWKGRAG